MNDGCLDEGALRLMLDSDAEPAARAHLAGCRTCTARLEELRSCAERSAQLLAAPALTTHDMQAAAARMRAGLRQRPPARAGEPLQRRTEMTISRTWRRALSAAGAVAIAVALLALPPVQAAADQLLKIFRVQQVVFVPVSQDRMEQLEQLNFDESTLFVAPPERVGEEVEPRSVASADEASAIVGYPVAQPVLPTPAASSDHTVHGPSSYSFQVNVESARQLLQLAGVTDVTLPDELGSAPITADVSSSVVSVYRGADYTVTLAQGVSPQLTMPDGVDLAQLGEAMLRLLGTSPEQAATLSQQIDWSTTFVFPFPAGMDGVRQVQVGDAQGLLVQGGQRGARTSQLYWHRDGRFYVLQASGAVGQDELVTIAASVR